MKLLDIIKEQEDWWNKPSYDKNIMDKSKKTLDNIQNMSPHTLADVLGVVTLIIPYVGPFISKAIGMADAALYWKQGDKKTATMVATFPFLPFGKLANLIPPIKQLGKSGMENLGKKVGKGSKQFSKLEQDALIGMSNNKDIFKQEMEKISKDLSSKSTQGAIYKFEKRFFLGECFTNGNCPAMNTIIKDFFSKLSNIAKQPKFLPSEVKVLSRDYVSGREVIETQLKDGTKVLFYKSSGSNVATTGKQSGEWFVIPGFAQDGWFFKTRETVNLTKGGNKYLTDMAEFLQMNGSQKLGK